MLRYACDSLCDPENLVVYGPTCRPNRFDQKSSLEIRKRIDQSEKAPVKNYFKLESSSLKDKDAYQTPNSKPTDAHLQDWESEEVQVIR